MNELAPAEIDILKSVWERFGAMDKWEIRDWTHQNCSEWQDPKGSSYPIHYETLARAVGFDDATAKELADQIQAQYQIARIFSGL